MGKTWYKVPLWVQKSFGPWTTYGGGGETIFTSFAGYRNFPYAGGLVQRDIGKKLTLGGEVFYHGAGRPCDAADATAALLDVGGYYKFRDPGFQLLFCLRPHHRGSKRKLRLPGALLDSGAINATRKTLR